MLSYLETADYAIREEMVLKVAILAEKYAVDYTWYARCRGAQCIQLDNFSKEQGNWEENQRWGKKQFMKEIVKYLKRLM